MTSKREPCPHGDAHKVVEPEKQARTIADENGNGKVDPRDLTPAAADLLKPFPPSKNSQ